MPGDIECGCLLAYVKWNVIADGRYRSMPLPPVSRLDSNTPGETRKGLRQRRNLHECYDTNVTALLAAINIIQSMVDQDTVERFLDVYDVHSDDIEEASLGSLVQATEDIESLKGLRSLHARHGTLRRLLLCSLLSLQATGRRADAVQWTTAVAQMQAVGSVAQQSSRKLNTILNDEERASTPLALNTEAMSSLELTNQQILPPQPPPPGAAHTPTTQPTTA